MVGPLATIELPSFNKKSKDGWIHDNNNIINKISYMFIDLHKASMSLIIG